MVPEEWNPPGDVGHFHSLAPAPVNSERLLGRVEPHGDDVTTGASKDKEVPNEMAIG